MTAEVRNDTQDVQNIAPDTEALDEQESLTAAVTDESNDVEEIVSDDREAEEDTITSDEYEDEEDGEYGYEDNEYGARDPEESYREFFLDRFSPLRGDDLWNESLEYRFRDLVHNNWELVDELHDYWGNRLREEKLGPYHFEFDGCPVTVDVNVTIDTQAIHGRSYHGAIGMMHIVLAKLHLDAHVSDFLGDIKDVSDVDWGNILPHLFRSAPITSSPSSIRVVQTGECLDRMYFGTDCVWRPKCELTDEIRASLQAGARYSACCLALAIAGMRTKVHTLLREKLDVLQEVSAEANAKLYRVRSAHRVEVLYGLPIVGPRVKRLLDEAATMCESAFFQSRLQPIQSAITEMYQNVIKLFDGEDKGTEYV